MPARPPRIVVDVVVVVVVVLTDVDASAERANDAIVYPLPRSSTPRALASSSFSDVVVLCRRPSSFARSRTPGARTTSIGRSIGRSVGRSDPRRRRRRPRGPYSSIDFTQRAIHFDTHTHTPLPPRARVRPSVRCRRTHDASCLSGATIASLLRPGRYFDLIVVVVLCRRHPSSASLVAPRTRTPRSSRNEERRVARATSDSFVRPIRSSDSFVRRSNDCWLEDWRIGGLEDRAVPSSCSVFRVPCSRARSTGKRTEWWAWVIHVWIRRPRARAREKPTGQRSLTTAEGSRG